VLLVAAPDATVETLAVLQKQRAGDDAFAVRWSCRDHHDLIAQHLAEMAEETRTQGGSAVLAVEDPGIELMHALPLRVRQFVSGLALYAQTGCGDMAALDAERYLDAKEAGKS